MTGLPRNSDCIFCKIVSGELPSFRLHEDADTIAFMDINPANPGHALSIAKGHWPTVDVIPPAALAAVALTAQRVAQAVMKELKPDGVNLLQSNGPGAGQTVPHLHIHVLPRRTGDDLPMTWSPRPGDRADIEAMCQRLKRRLTMAAVAP